MQQMLIRFHVVANKPINNNYHYRFGVPPPVYINVVREPVDRLISHYYYKSFGSNNAPSNVSRTNMVSSCSIMLHSGNVSTFFICRVTTQHAPVIGLQDQHGECQSKLFFQNLYNVAFVYCWCLACSDCV